MLDGPMAALAGGALIGGAASLLLVVSGRVAGISGILGGLFDGPKGGRGWRVAFLAGLVAGFLAAPAFSQSQDPMRIDPAIQRERDTTRLGILQDELAKETRELDAAQTELRDAENVLLRYVPEKDEQGADVLDREAIDDYFAREVLPHVPDAWIDYTKTKVGYEVNFTKYFYQYKPLRSLAEIRDDILALEAETDGMIKAVIQTA